MILVSVFQPLDHCTLKNRQVLFLYFEKVLQATFPSHFIKLEWEKTDLYSSK